MLCNAKKTVMLGVLGGQIPEHSFLSPAHRGRVALQLSPQTLLPLQLPVQLPVQVPVLLLVPVLVLPAA